jgi:nucleoid-associated protein YgaU
MRIGASSCPLLGLLVVLLASASASAGAERVHVVQPGETLWHIAAQVAGDPHLWPRLYRANRDQIVDPSRLYPGQVLSIPDFQSDAPETEAVPGGPASD